MVSDSNVIQVELATPDQLPVKMEAAEVILPGSDGVFAVLPGHTPLLTTLIPGTLVIYGTDGAEHFYATNGGFAEVLDNRVLILSQTAEEPDQIDVARAQAARERAEKRLTRPEPSVDLARAEAALHRALARLQTQSKKHY